MLNFLKKANGNTIQKEWFEKGAEYARAVNEMVSFATLNGWENWKGKEPEDQRSHLVKETLELLRAANKRGEIKKFRERFPPAHSPLVEHIKANAQSIEQLHFINGEKIVFLTGTSYQKRQAYVLKGDQLITLDESIRAIGKSKLGDVFAIAVGNKITTTQGWQGKIIRDFSLKEETANLGITELVPFNDGEKLLMVTADGIFIISATTEKMIHPVYDEQDADWSPNIDMENATLSNNNDIIVVGDQGSDHRILDNEGSEIGSIGPQSSYPHFCLFSKDDEQLLTNSCHFYNGVSIGVNTDKLPNIEIPAYVESGEFIVLDEDMRVYKGIATSQYYILGDAYGYIRAIDKKGKLIWRHHLGSSISGITISDDEKTLWVAACSGILHKLKLGEGQGEHTIGNGNHKEEFRLILWKNEPGPLFW